MVNYSRYICAGKRHLSYPIKSICISWTKLLGKRTQSTNSCCSSPCRGVWGLKKKKSPETTLKNWRNPKHHQGTCYPRDFCLVIMMEVLFYLCYQRIGDYGGPSGGISFHPFGVCIFVDIHFCWYPSDNMDWNMVVCFEDRCGISSPNFRCGLFPKWILLNQWSWEEGDMVTWIYINSDSFWRLMEVTNQIQPVIHHLATQMKDNHSPS